MLYKEDGRKASILEKKKNQEMLTETHRRKDLTV